MKPKFEIGDKVIEKEPCFGGYGYVTSVNHYNNPDCYVVKFANGEERVSYIEDFCVEDSEIKTAFPPVCKNYWRRLTLPFTTMSNTSCALT